MSTEDLDSTHWNEKTFLGYVDKVKELTVIIESMDMDEFKKKPYRNLRCVIERSIDQYVNRTIAALSQHT
jgi:hypothetical protein